MHSSEILWKWFAAVGFALLIVASATAQYGNGNRDDGQYQILQARYGTAERNIDVTNRLKEHTTMHWHGFILPSGMDGVGGLSQAHIEPAMAWLDAGGRRADPLAPFGLGIVLRLGGFCHCGHRTARWFVQRAKANRSARA